MDEHPQGADRPSSYGDPNGHTAAGAPCRPRVSGPGRATVVKMAGVVALLAVLGARLADPGTVDELPAAAPPPTVAAGTDPAAQRGPLPTPQRRSRPAAEKEAGRPWSGGGAVGPSGGAATPRADRPTHTAPVTSAATATAPPHPVEHEVQPPTSRAPVPSPPRPAHEGRPGTAPAGGGNPSAATRTATATEQVGVVDVVTVLDFGAGTAAGTGIVLPSGEILTNNHVIRGATQITVTAVTTGDSSPASVVGTDPTDDVAVLRLSGGSAGPPAVLAGAVDVVGVAVGEAVVAVGNARGVGGIPTAAPGTVVALDQDITASEGGTGAAAQRLHGLIEFTAAIQPGDSGGPLYAKGAVIGIDTAGSAGARAAGPTVGYAIPISAATAIAGRVLAGEHSSTIHQGLPAFLGVDIAVHPGAVGGARISGVVADSPAAAAGLTAGATITTFGATAVNDPAALATLLDGHRPQDQVTVSWTDPAGTAHTATLTLAAGPAD